MERFSSAATFFCGSRALFTRPASMDFSKINFKTKSHDTIHTFKNYFVTIFSIFSNKRYPNIPLMFDKFPCFIFFVGWFFLKIIIIIIIIIIMHSVNFG